jgi:hypothetical protein
LVPAELVQYVVEPEVGSDAVSKDGIDTTTLHVPPIGSMRAAEAFPAGAQAASSEGGAASPAAHAVPAAAPAVGVGGAPSPPAGGAASPLAHGLAAAAAAAAGPAAAGAAGELRPTHNASADATRKRARAIAARRDSRFREGWARAGGADETMIN